MMNDNIWTSSPCECSSGCQSWKVGQMKYFCHCNSVALTKRKTGLGGPRRIPCESQYNWSSVCLQQSSRERQHCLLACLLYQQDRNGLGLYVWVLAANEPGLASTIYSENAPRGLPWEMLPFSKSCYMHVAIVHSAQSLILWWSDMWLMIATQLILLSKCLCFFCWLSPIINTDIHI